VSPEYQSIYFRNRYEVEGPSSSPFIFSLEHFIDSTFFDRPFSIITACNPQNTILSSEQNRERNQQLYSSLYTKDYKILDATGCLEGHCEAGYLIYDISLREALELGLTYDQYTIFYCDTKYLKYVRCETEEVVVEKRRKETLPESRP